MNTNLKYSIYMPSNMVTGRKYPVIYAMHGRGSNEGDISNLLKELQDDFIIIGIRGTLVLNDGFEYFTIKSFGNPNIDSFNEAIEQLEKFIGEASKAYPIETSEQFLFGFSQGAILSMSLSLRMGDRIKGAVALSGYIPKHMKETYEMKSVQNLRIYIAHGEFDPIFPKNIGNDNYEYFKCKTENVKYKIYPIGHEVSTEEMSDFISWFKLNK